jgi:hypothetical protein
MKKNKKFLLNIEMDMPKCVKTRVKDETWLWHMRLRHANFDNLEMMTQKKMWKGLPSIIHPNYLCEGCWRVYHPLYIQITCVKDVLWPNNSATAFQRTLHLEEVNLYKRYMQVYMVLFNHAHLVKNCIFYFLLKIIVKEHGYTS